MKRPLITFTGLMTLALASSPALADMNEKLKLLPSDGAAFDYFGEAVAISGNTIIVGAPGDDDLGSGSGSAYLFNATTGAQMFKLFASDGAAGDSFGCAVSISGSLAIVGASGDGDLGASSGSAYVYNTSTGQQVFKLLPAGGLAHDRFGDSVGISGSIAIIGADGDDGNGPFAGAAYLFDLTTGTQLFKLLPSDGADGHWFGGAVAVDGSTAIVGRTWENNSPKSGSVYLFDATTGVQLSKIVPGDGEENDLFGHSVAISEGFRFVSGAVAEGAGHSTGSAYLYDATNLVEVAKLLASDGVINDLFGFSVAISGNVAISCSVAMPGIGKAYLFDATTGAQYAKLLQSDGAAGDAFGCSVGVSADNAIVGASRDDDLGSDSGSTYLFKVASSGTAFCFGSEGAMGSLCPCAASAGGTGCVNSTGSGAVLTGVGGADVLDDTFVLAISGSLPGGFGLLFQGDSALVGGSGIPWGNGLLCINPQRRWDPLSADVQGALSYGPGLMSTDPAAVPGATVLYQWWYRDVADPCGGGFNYSNAWSETWQ
jgi:hypothetical protein